MSGKRLREAAQVNGSKAIRRLPMASDGYACITCATWPRYLWPEADQAVAVAEDGERKVSNLQPLCGYSSRIKGTQGKGGNPLKMGELRPQRGHRRDGGRVPGGKYRQAVGRLPPKAASVAPWGQMQVTDVLLHARGLAPTGKCLVGDKAGLQQG